MSDVFNEDDAALVLEFYEGTPKHYIVAYLYRGRGSGDCYYSTISDRAYHDIKIEHISRFERMGVVDAAPWTRSPNMNELLYVKLNIDHPDVKQIVDAMELL
jgi:hypothetical protein